jgi:hypothetical protein
MWLFKNGRIHRNCEPILCNFLLHQKKPIHYYYTLQSPNWGGNSEKPTLSHTLLWDRSLMLNVFLMSFWLQLPGLNIITELIIGYLYPGRPVANVCFKTYGYISMTQAVSFLMDFKLGHTLILLVCVAFMKNCMYLHLPSMKYQIV